MRPVEDFSREVAPDVPDCPLPMIGKAVIDAAQDLCRIAELWFLEHPNLLLIPGVGHYDLDIPEGALMAGFLTVQNGQGDPVDEKSVGWLNQNRPNWRTERAEPVEFVVSDQRRSIEVVPVPRKVTMNGLQNMRLLLMPARDADSLPDFFYEYHLEVIGYGTRSRLMRQPSKPWSDSRTANEYEVLFAREAEKARVNHNRGASGRVLKLGMKRGMYT